MHEDDPTVTNLPKGYKLQYWNNSFWVDIVSVTTDVAGESTYEFDAIETSAIRLVLIPDQVGGDYFSGYIREIEVWGNM